ncbi:hypothetical protein BLNAU_8991 [Blattamonas nauphoetae]|uniref:Uncharacterized protein n=1 Tax=Blattamonas nauphoetae TaxID=2049346 RepID=A0ABQ9XX28_9EUKA|nr:hypothetical protein BLNAU_8991 [Blattamonas nauphoetae]
MMITITLFISASIASAFISFSYAESIRSDYISTICTLKQYSNHWSILPSNESPYGLCFHMFHVTTRESQSVRVIIELTGGKCVEHARKYTSWPENHSNISTFEPTARCYVNIKNKKNILLYYPTRSVSRFILLQFFFLPAYLFYLLTVVAFGQSSIRSLLSLCIPRLRRSRSSQTQHQQHRRERPLNRQFRITGHNHTRIMLDRTIRMDVINLMDVDEQEPLVGAERRAQMDDWQFALGLYLSERQQTEGTGFNGDIDEPHTNQQALAVPYPDFSVPWNNSEPFISDEAISLLEFDSEDRLPTRDELSG